jgi:hypothetical protein
LDPEPTSLIRQGLLPARQAEALPILLARGFLIIRSEIRAIDSQIELLEISMHRLDPRVGRYRIGQPKERRLQPAHHLHRTGAVVANLVECQHQIVLPCWHRKNETQNAIRIVAITRVQIVPSQPAQQVLDLVDSLDRRGRIVNRRRQRLDGDINEQPNGIFRILLRRPFKPKVDGPQKVPLGQRSSGPMNLQQQRIFNEGIADPAYHHDDRRRLLCLANQVADIETGNRARWGEIP